MTWRRSTNSCVRDLILDDHRLPHVVRPEGYRRALLKLLRPFPAASSRSATWPDQLRRALRRPADRRHLGSSAHYDGTADFGPLTGSPRSILGVSQFLVQNGRIVREAPALRRDRAPHPDPRRAATNPYPTRNIY